MLNRVSSASRALVLGAAVAAGAVVSSVAAVNARVTDARFPASFSRDSIAKAMPQFSRVYPNVKYDGRFQLVRLRYIEYQSNGWYFDYPDMEEHLMTMFDELTSIKLARKGSNILSMDDPELMKWPVAYLSEPGFWYPNESEAAGLRTFLKKGGFLIVDDFYEGSRTPEWAVFDKAIHMVLPDAKLIPLDVSNPIYDIFYRIKTLKDIPYPTAGFQWIKAQFYGIYEDNDPHKRLMAVVNYDIDLGDYMEWSGSGLWPVNLSNDAYKFAMNYIIYGLVF